MAQSAEWVRSLQTAQILQTGRKFCGQSAEWCILQNEHSVCKLSEQPLYAVCGLSQFADCARVHDHSAECNMHSAECKYMHRHRLQNRTVCRLGMQFANCINQFANCIDQFANCIDQFAE